MMSARKQISIIVSKAITEVRCGSPKHAKKAANIVETSDKMIMRIMKMATGFDVGSSTIFAQQVGIGLEKPYYSWDFSLSSSD